MSDPRQRPFVWVTWIAPLLSGDRHCHWAPWFKAHYFYEKIDEDEQQAANLRKWKGEHADMVRARQAALEAAGWRVSVEDQNKFFVRGQTATLAGGPDLVAVRDNRWAAANPGLRAVSPGGGELDRPDAEAVVEDCKTGRRRDSDHWQVLIYMTFLPAQHAALADGRPLTGAVIYQDGGHGLAAQAADSDVRARIGAAVREAGGPAAPPRTPSPAECRYCDIAACPDRAIGETPTLDTDLF